jgi:serine/threonine-protein kinase
MVGHVLLGKYRVVRPLDRGGLSRLYVARRLNDNQEVVVKVLKEEYLSQGKAVAHFRHEIQIMARFRHPNAVGFVDAAPDDPAGSSGPILVLEYLRGVDLGVLLRREGRLAPDRTGRILAQLCEVLAAAHRQGIVHSDLKPGNIFILHPGTPQETVKLMDFGLAQMRALLYFAPEELKDRSLPCAAGTPDYMSPEQVLGQTVDSRSDLYSVGVILFEMLSGYRPFERSSTEALLRAHTREEPPTFADLGLEEPIPLAIEEVVRACLAKYPEERPQDASELLERYERALGRKLTASRLSSSGPSAAVRARTALPGPTETTPAPSGIRRVLGAGPPPAPRGPEPPPLRAAGRYQVQHSIDAYMPESMAIVKLKGFIQDLGGEVVETSPGLIRVRLPEPAPASSKSDGSSWGDLFSWLGGKKETAPGPHTDVELRLERRDPMQPSRMTIVVVMLPPNGMPTLEWQSRCKRITQNLQAYLMSR